MSESGQLGNGPGRDAMNLEDDIREVVHDSAIPLTPKMIQRRLEKRKEEEGEEAPKPRTVYKYLSRMNKAGLEEYSLWVIEYGRATAYWKKRVNRKGDPLPIGHPNAGEPYVAGQTQTVLTMVVLGIIIALGVVIYSHTAAAASGVPIPGSNLVVAGIVAFPLAWFYQRFVVPTVENLTAIPEP